MPKPSRRRPARPLYRDPRRPIAERIEDLLGRMTPEEKVGQTLQLFGKIPDIADWVRDRHLGSVLGLLREDTIALQETALASRLGIPLLFGIDAIHGHSFDAGATIFPSQLGMSCSWDEGLIEEAARVTAIEASCTGVHWTFSPVFCLPRDLRWGRVNETFGEDPMLIGRFGAAMVRGYQGRDLRSPQSIAACAKHYAGYGDTAGGRDAAEAGHSRRTMRSLFLPPFRAAVEAGVASLMTAYQAIDGQPCTVNRWLLTEVLRGEWGSDALLVTDWDNVGSLHRGQRVCATIEEAAARAIEAGNDLIMQTPGYYDAALAALRSGALPAAALDEAVRRVLRIKFRLGLFENPRLPDAGRAGKVVGCPAHRRVALRAARGGVVLLKNNGILPLAPSRLRRLAVIGPNADNPQDQLGDWSLCFIHTHGRMAHHPRQSVVTVRDGLERRFGPGTAVEYAQGCSGTDAQPDKIARAVRVAESADAVVLVLGDALAYVGEGKSTATLELMGGQNELFAAVAATGTPVVVVLLASKPLAIPDIARRADAVLCAFNPGMEGGTALAEILAGDVSPCGRLSLSFPQHVGQQPVFYNQPPGAHQQGYPDLPGTSFDGLFPFGFGLTYTTFRYRRLRLASQTLRPGEPVVAEVDVFNAGEREGTETVQCYLHDRFTSVTWPVKVLKDYRRVTLPSGEMATVRFELPYESLALADANGDWVVEPGEFTLMVGSSSRDADLLRAEFSVQG